MIILLPTGKDWSHTTQSWLICAAGFRRRLCFIVGAGATWAHRFPWTALLSVSLPPAPPARSSRMVLERLHSSTAGRLSGSVHSHFLSVVFSPNDSTFLLTAADDASSYTDRKQTPPPDRHPVDSAKSTSCGDCLCCLFLRLLMCKKIFGDGC